MKGENHYTVTSHNLNLSHPDERNRNVVLAFINILMTCRTDFMMPRGKTEFATSGLVSPCSWYTAGDNSARTKQR